MQALTPMANDHRIFLAKRLREFTKSQPELRELRRILLGLGGAGLIPPADRDPMTNLLIDFGIVFAGPVMVKLNGERRNLRRYANIWRRRLYGMVGFGVGYALDDSGLWREHTFGILREGVLEIMAPKQKYFGLLLINEVADAFAETLQGSPEIYRPPAHRRPPGPANSGPADAGWSERLPE